MKNETMTLLQTVIILQMAAESLDELKQTTLNQKQLKPLIKQFLKYVDPIVQKNYNKMFGIDEETTQQIISEYEKHVKRLAVFEIPTQISYCQFEEAWQLDRLKTENLIHSVLKEEKVYSYDELRKIAYNAFCLGQMDNPTENVYNGWIEQFKEE